MSNFQVILTTTDEADDSVIETVVGENARKDRAVKLFEKLVAEIGASSDSATQMVLVNPKGDTVLRAGAEALEALRDAQLTREGELESAEADGEVDEYDEDKLDAEDAAVAADEANDGTVRVQLRNEKHGRELAPCMEGRDSHVDGDTLVVLPSEAQDVFDDLMADAPNRGLFARRLLVLAAMQLRQHFPNVEDKRPALSARVITTLNERGIDWSIGSAYDGTPQFTFGGETHKTAKSAAAALGVPSSSKEKVAA